jgi:stage II sporulation protein D
MRNAAESTQGEIILYQGEPIKALFFSNAAGHTDDVQNVFGGELAYLQGVESYETPDSYKYETVVTFSQDEFYAKLREKYPEITEGKVEILARDDSGRVQTVQIGDNELTGVEVRTALALNSANFTITVSGGDLVFDVKGYGHGVGLSQAGAEEMAKMGYDYREILQHYYTGVEIE